MNYEKYFSVGIQPTGTGSSGVCIKTFNDYYPRKWSKMITCDNPIDMAENVINFVDEIGQKLNEKDFHLKDVIVNLTTTSTIKSPNDDDYIATKQLIAILKYFYKSKFRGYAPTMSEQKIPPIKQSAKKSPSEYQAEAIMYLHFRALKLAKINWNSKKTINTISEENKINN